MVGFAAFGRNPDYGEIWIARYMIAADHQRRGLVPAGLRALIRLLRNTRGCSAIYLDVRSDNVAAVGLYENAGFFDTGKTQGKNSIYRADLEGGQGSWGTGRG